ncbi:hypothetical protein TNCV_2657811 [Trichonephila clavipes]|nr:hypothetical protein TNCV_2657811 [Trichonephila clavipes]
MTFSAIYFTSAFLGCRKLYTTIYVGSVGSLVIRASDSTPEGLGSMPDATKYPPSTHGVRARSIRGSESLVGGPSRNQECRELETISLPSSSMPKL